MTDPEAEALLDLLREPLHVRATDPDSDAEERLQAVLNGAWRAAKEVQTLRAQLRSVARDVRRADPAPPEPGQDLDTDPALRDWRAHLDLVRLERMLDAPDSEAVLARVAGLLAREDTDGPACPLEDPSELWAAYDPEEGLLLYPSETDARDDAQQRLDAWLDDAPPIPHEARLTYVMRVVWQCSDDDAPELLRRQDVPGG